MAVRNGPEYPGGFIAAINRNGEEKGRLLFLLVVSLVFAVLGSLYLWIGVKEKESNRWISASAIIQLIAVGIGTFGYLYPLQMEFGILLTLVLEIISTILMAIVVVLLIVGWKKLSVRKINL